MLNYTVQEKDFPTYAEMAQYLESNTYFKWL